MAYDLELPEVTRHDLWRRGGIRQIRLRNDGQQVSDPGLCGRRNYSRLASARRDLKWHCRNVPYRFLLLRRQRPDVRDLRLGAVWTQCAHAEFLVVPGRR